eukprot:gene13936-15388_t
MEQQYRRTLDRFYQTQGTKYSKLAQIEKREQQGNSSDNDETTLYTKPDKNRNHNMDEEEVPMISEDEKSRKFTRVKPVQPVPFCSRRMCILLLVWMLLFLIAVLGLTIFIQQVLKRVADTEQDQSHHYVKYEDYASDGNHTSGPMAESCDDFVITPIWHSIFEKLQTETAIRFIDINSDSVDDVIVGFGTGVDGYNVQRIVCDLHFNGTYPCYGGAMALDGRTGRQLWRHYSMHEVYAVNCNGDIDNDGVRDCLLGGRGGAFDAVSGKNGALLWTFDDEAVRSEIMNMYTAQFIRDFDNDGVMEVLQVHGGDPLAEAFSEKRLVGRIIIFSGKTGKILRWVETPDKKESYFSPVLYTLKNGTELVVFGTGGETHGGGLFVIKLSDLYYGKIEKSVLLYEDKLKGVMNPPVLIDLNKDGTLDIVSAMFNSTVVAFDGETLKSIWSFSTPNSESYSVPAPAYFNKDDSIDFMVRSNYGPGFPIYYHSNITILDGTTGRPIIKSAFKTSGTANPSPLAVSMQGRGNDLYLYWTADCVGHEGEGGKFSFVEGTNVHEQSRADTCRLRYGTRGFSRFSVMNAKTFFPGKTIYDSEVYKDLENSPIKSDHYVINRRNIEKQKKKLKLLQRLRRHIGIPDHGGIQRLISTGGLTSAINSISDRFGFTDSIDVVFPVYWIYPAKVRLLDAKDIECVKRYRQLATQGKFKLNVDIDENHSKGFYDEGDTAVNYCLRNRTRPHSDDKAFYNSQSTYDPKKIHMGRLIVHRFNIRCVCNSHKEKQKRCAKILPMAQQGWTGYMECFKWSDFYASSNSIANPINGSLGVVYSGTVSRDKEDMYHMDYSTFSKSGKRKAVRLSVKSNSATADFPVLFVVRMVKGVRSWTVPLSAADGKIFHHVSRSLCPELNTNGNTTMPYFYIDVSTQSLKPINYTLHAYIVNHFSLRSGEQNAIRNISVNPAEPMYFRYKFEPDIARVLVKVTSKSKLCGMVLVQNSKCPVFEEGTNDFSGLYATITTKAAITVSSKVINTNSFYVVLLVKDADRDCLVHKGDINPFQRHESLQMHNKETKTLEGKPAKKSYEPLVPAMEIQRMKYFDVEIEELPTDHQYAPAILAPILVYGGFYLMALIVIMCSWCKAEDGGRSFIAYLMPSKVKNGSSDIVREDTPLVTPSDDPHGYGITQHDNRRMNSSSQVEEETGSSRQLHSPSVLDQDFDLLNEIDEHKDIYRLKRNLYLSDVTKKSHKKLRKRFNVYYWNIITIAIFYALPVIQLVLTYQRVVNTSGDQDICYYNFLCARPLSVLSAFNNVYSNIGYVMLGILFLLLVLRRDRLGKQRLAKNPDRENNFGIPKHYGILYAMGFALIMEGVLSACYHVCPNYSNFQFDTAFMYIIGLLGGLRLYQTRHHDIVINGHLAFTSFAIVIFTSVIGVVFRSKTFWGIFMVLHLVTCFYLSAKIYYMGRVRAAFSEMLMLNRKDLGVGPVFKDRFVLLLIFNIVNAALSINGLVNMPSDFATYLLGIIILNGMLYVIFYVFMKIRYKEKIKALPLVCTMMSLAIWSASLYFFTRGITNWQKSPAQSREGNRSCVLFLFYDHHDVWHFLSSIAMFFTFMSVMTLDDDIDQKERTKINVF